MKHMLPILLSAFMLFGFAGCTQNTSNKGLSVSKNEMPQPDAADSGCAVSDISGQPDSNDLDTDKYIAVADEFLIDRANALFFYTINSNGILNPTKVLDNTLSVIQYPRRYTNNAIADVLTIDGMGI